MQAYDAAAMSSNGKIRATEPLAQTTIVASEAALSFGGNDFTETDNFACGGTAEDSWCRGCATEAMGFRCCSDEP